MSVYPEPNGCRLREFSGTLFLHERREATSPSTTAAGALGYFAYMHCTKMNAIRVSATGRDSPDHHPTCAVLFDLAIRRGRRRISETSTSVVAPSHTSPRKTTICIGVHSILRCGVDRIARYRAHRARGSNRAFSRWYRCNRDVATWGDRMVMFHEGCGCCGVVQASPLRVRCIRAHVGVTMCDGEAHIGCVPARCVAKLRTE